MSIFLVADFLTFPVEDELQGRSLESLRVPAGMYQDGTEIQRHLPQKVQKCHLSLLDLQRLHCLETLFLHHSRQNLRIPHFFILLQKMGFWTTLSRIMNPSHSQLLDLSSQTPNSCRG